MRRWVLIGLMGASLTGCASGPPRHIVRARFECNGVTRLDVVFDHDRNVVTVKLPRAHGEKQRYQDVPSQNPASGIWYAGEGYELRGAGDALTYTAPGQAPMQCVQTR